MGELFRAFNRKEVVYIGSAFERSYLLMQTAVKHYGKIYVDHNTKLTANHFLDFQFIEMLEFSHKMLNESIFQVIADPSSTGPSTKRGNKSDQGIGLLVQDSATSNTLDEKTKAR